MCGKAACNQMIRQLQRNAENEWLRFMACENAVVRDMLKRSLGNEVEMLLLLLTL